MTLDFDSLERLLAEATPGPWTHYLSGGGGMDPWHSIKGGREAGPQNPVSGQRGETSAADAELIVALHAAAPSLIALAKRAQEAEAVRDEFQEQAKRAGDKCEQMERVVEAVRLQRKTAAEHGRPFEATDPVGLALRALEEK
jgi:hypothetical protein